MISCEVILDIASIAIGIPSQEARFPIFPLKTNIYLVFHHVIGGYLP